jgi:vancomycin permeability regulator SanA
MTRPPAPSRLRQLLRLATWTVAAALLAGACLMAALVADGLSDELAPTDVGIVLGSQVLPDGRLSERLQARLDAAVAQHRAGVFPRLIVSGGTGVEGVNEALRMRDYLLAQQVPAAAIEVDEHGVTTRATARNCAALMRQRGWTSATVVTQHFHVTRSRLALRAEGIATVNGVHAPFIEWRDLYSTPREAVALLAYALGR